MSLESKGVSRIGRRQFLQAASAAGAVSLTPALNFSPTLFRSEPKKESDEAIHLVDMSVCRPQSALARKPRRNHWRLLDYATENFSGVMLVAGQNTAAPEIAYPVNSKGWYAIHFGLRSIGGAEDQTDQTIIQVRLSSESTFTRIRCRKSSENQIDEYFWRNAELAEEEIVIRQLRTQTVPENPASVGNACYPVWLAYIKLIPLSEESVREFQNGKHNSNTRRPFAHNDAWDYTYSYRPTTVEEIRLELEPLRDTDFSRIYWEAGMGDRMYYPTKLGLTATDDWIEDPYYVGERLAAEAWRSFRDQAIDPFRVALDYAHDVGLEFHATYRTAGFHFPVPEEEWNTGGVFDKHPEWRGCDRSGHFTPRLSYAYPAVRKMVLGFLKEIAVYPIDGICLAYNRRPPLVEYELPVVEAFQARYGQDPRRLEDRDHRWLSFRADVLTQFMREVRAALKETAEEQHRSNPIEVSAIVMSTEAENLYYAMDLQAWIDEGLVDTIIPYTSVERLLSSADSWVNPKDAEFFLKITRNTKCRLALNMMPRQLRPEEYRRRALALYQAGADYLFFWDCDGRSDFSSSWTALRRLGHREELIAWARAGSPELDRPGSKLRKLGDWDLTYATPG